MDYITIRIQKEIHKKLKKIAKIDRRTMQEVLRLMIEEREKQNDK